MWRSKFHLHLCLSWPSCSKDIQHVEFICWVRVSQTGESTRLSPITTLLVQTMKQTTRKEVMYWYATHKSFAYIRNKQKLWTGLIFRCSLSLYNWIDSKRREKNNKIKVISKNKKTTFFGAEWKSFAVCLCVRVSVCPSVFVLHVCADELISRVDILAIYLTVCVWMLRMRIPTAPSPFVNDWFKDKIHKHDTRALADMRSLYDILWYLKRTLCVCL